MALLATYKAIYSGQKSIKQYTAINNYYKSLARCLATNFIAGRATT